MFEGDRLTQPSKCEDRSDKEPHIEDLASFLEEVCQESAEVREVAIDVGERIHGRSAPTSEGKSNEADEPLGAYRRMERLMRVISHNLSVARCQLRRI